ncbi:uncharacterized protein LOC110047929 isoform X2 [Orbicella faveolata]|uniref:uncharacterized protein LOC110047929 isoform X2 n=1 Tax=Orbicella faveolata TaxID=48498 RepID=UPI0009E1E728|nr:uncharacterized protein LOC110047929 isoform X2 [Orbicella faveolata]
MNFVFVVAFMVIYLAVGVHSAPIAYSVSNDKLTLNIPIEDLWDGLSKGHRYPIINSGDTVALRSAYTASTSWLHCHKSHGDWHSCQGSTILTSTGWTSCSTLTFTITARGKSDGEPINSGDTASLSSNSYGSSYRLYCSASSSTHCTVQSTTSSMTGGAWLSYSYVTFEIYSKNADDGNPVQYGDVVGLKYPYSSNSAWLTQDSGRFYPRSCSSSSKTSCAAENSNTGFNIFKKLS